MKPRRGSWPAGDSAAAGRASSSPAVTPSAMGRATRGALDKRTPRGRGTGQEPSERAAPPAGSDTPCRARQRPIGCSRPRFAPVRPAPVARVSAWLRGRLLIGAAQDRAGSGPGGDGLDLDAGPQRQGGHPERPLIVNQPSCLSKLKYLTHRIIQESTKFTDYFLRDGAIHSFTNKELTSPQRRGM